MILKIKYSCLVALLLALNNGFSQDKLFLKNGKKQLCVVGTITSSLIIYKDSASQITSFQILKKDVLLLETNAGEIFIFGDEPKKANTDLEIENPFQQKKRLQKEWKQKEDSLPNNIIGMYPHEALFGRLTFSYERLFASKSLGILIPFSATYNILQNAKNSKTNAPINNSKGIGIITGLDVNYYYDLKPTLKYFFGPRFRYGTHMTLGAVEGFNFQLQNGLLKSKGKYFTNTFAMGVGFFKLSQKYANYPGYDPKLIIPWASFTWRLGFRL